jgi:hypothetical protein
MRYDEARYADDRDYVRTRPELTPRQVSQVQTFLNEARRGQVLYPEITADQNDYPLGEGVIHLFTSDASRTITGFASVGPGIQVISNIGAQNLVLANDNAGSAEANQILAHTGANITLNPNESALIYYDDVTGKVRTVGFG